MFTEEGKKHAPHNTLDDMIQDRIEDIFNDSFDKITDPEEMTKAVLKMKQKLVDDLFSGVTAYNFREFIDGK